VTRCRTQPASGIYVPLCDVPPSRPLRIIPGPGMQSSGTCGRRVVIHGSAPREIVASQNNPICALLTARSGKLSPQQNGGSVRVLRDVPCHSA